MACTVVVVVVLLFSECVSARKLVNEKVSVHASVNYSMHKQYDHEPVRNISLDLSNIKDLSDISKFNDMLKNLNPEAYDFIKNIFSKGSTESVKPVTPNLPEYGSSKHENSTTSEHSSEYVTKALRHVSTKQTSIGYSDSINTSEVYSAEQETTNSNNVKSIQYGLIGSHHDDITHKTSQNDPEFTTYPSINIKDYTESTKSASLSEDGSRYRDQNSKLVPFGTEEFTHDTTQNSRYYTTIFPTKIFTDSIKTSAMQPSEYESKIAEAAKNLHQPKSNDHPTSNSETYPESAGTSTTMPEYTQGFSDWIYKESGYEPTDLAHQTSEDGFYEVPRYSTVSLVENIDIYESSALIPTESVFEDDDKSEGNSLPATDNTGYLNTNSLKDGVEETTGNPVSNITQLTTLFTESFKLDSTITGHPTEEVDHSTAIDEINESTSTPENVLDDKLATISPEYGYGQKDFIKGWENSTTGTSISEPIVTASSHQEVTFPEQDATTFNTNADHLSTYPTLDTNISEKDVSSQVKENSDSITKWFTPTIDSVTQRITEYQPDFSETTLSDECSSHISDRFSLQLATQNTISEEDHSNHSTDSVNNSTYSTVDSLSFQETESFEDDVENSNHTTNPQTTSNGSEEGPSAQPQAATDEDTYNITDVLCHNISAVHSGEELSSDSSSLNNTHYVVRNCYGISRRISVVTDPQELTKNSVESDQVSIEMNETRRLSSNDSKAHIDEESSMPNTHTSPEPTTQSYSTQSSLISHRQDFDSLHKLVRSKGDPQRNNDDDNFQSFDQNILEVLGKSSSTPSIEDSIFQQDHKVTNETFDIGNKNEIDSFSITNIPPPDPIWNLIGTNISRRVRRGELPFVVSLQEKSGYHFCCGSILTSTWILTAAHCFRPLNRRDARNLQVMVGSHRLPGDPSDTQILQVAYTLWHESFLINAYTDFENDIAVLKLASEVEFSDVVGISVLSMDRDWSQEHEVVLGFSSFYNSELLQLKLASPLESDCRSNQGRLYFNGFVCLNDPLECLVEEDSGAPIIVDGLQTGVATHSHKKITGFLRVSSYFSWIQNNTGYVWPEFSPVGQVAKKGEFPFVVLLRTKDNMIHCTGTILSPEWVLAPGHCFRDVNDTSNYEMLAGLTRLIDAYAVIRNISAIVWYEGENPNAYRSLESNGNQDFVLLQLEKNLTSHRAIQATRLPEQTDDISLTGPIQAIGWQNLLVGECITQYLHHVNLTLLTREQCVKKIGNNTDITLCVDSRKPLFKGIMGSVVVQNGVVVGFSAEDQSQFTLIQPLLEWITRIVF